MMLRQGLALDRSCLFVPDVCVKKKLGVEEDHGI